MPTKTEKKGVIASLITQFLQTKDIDELKALKTQIVKQVTDCPFSEESMDNVAFGISTWANDLDNYISQVEQGTVDSQLKVFTNLSLAGLKNFVDTSLLPD